jgi:two-component system, OmpR family, response regulator
MNVVVLNWPAEQGRLGPLQAMGIPRLLLVARDEPPPVCADPLADWVFASALDDEVEARVAALAARARARTGARPAVDEAGVLRCDGETLALSPREALLTRCFLDHLDQVVSRDDLARSVWPVHGVQPKTLDMHIVKLRRRIAPVGLEIETVRTRGWVMRTLHAGTD